MSDLALYRAVEPVGGKLKRLFTDEEGVRRVEVQLARKVSAVVRVEVNRRPSPGIEFVNLARILVAIPDELLEVPLSRLVLVILAEADFESIGEAAVPSTVGLGSRLTLLDGEAQAVQTALRTLLMSPGSDTWNRSRGGNLRALRNVMIDPTNLTAVTRMVQVAVDRYNATRSSAQSSRNLRNTTKATHTVVRVEMLSIRVMSRAEAQFDLGLLRTTDSIGIGGGAGYDPTDTVVAISLAHTVRGPSRSQVVSSSLAI